LGAQTAHAELLEQALAVSVQRSVANLSGGFAKKKVKGHPYWYYQFRGIDGRLRQLYIGSDTAQVRRLVTQSSEVPPVRLEPMARSTIALGAERVLPAHFRIIRRLEEHGFFRAGGVLIGTHAFLLLGNQLGVRWTHGSRTQDMDFAHPGKNISIALPATIEVNVPKAIESLEMGLLPLSALGGDSGFTYLNPRDPELRLDFVTTRARRGQKAVHLRQLNLELQPLEYMEFLLEGPITGLAISDEGAAIVNLPSAVRYALHKLVVAVQRSPRWRAKAKKDVQQAAAIIDWATTHDRDALLAAWADLLSRGPTWRKKARQGRAALEQAAPDLEVERALPL
jgi:hypothetical protein